jgi:hypothetical protein
MIIEKSNSAASITIAEPVSLRPGETWGIVLLLLAFVACLNVGSLGALRLALGLYAGVLLIIGLRDLRYLMLILIGLEPIRPTILSFGTLLGFQMTFNRIIVPIAVVCYLLNRSKFSYRVDRKEPLLFILAGLSALSLLTDLLGDGTFLAGAQRTFSESVEVLLFAYICYRVFKSSELSTVVASFSIGGVLLCLCIFWEHFWNTNLLFRFPVPEDLYGLLVNANLTLDRAGTLRVRGPFQNSVYLSAFLPLVLFAAIYLLVAERRRLLGGTLLVMTVLSATFSISRTAIFALAICGVPALLYQARRMGIGRIIGYASTALVILLLLYAIFPTDLQRAADLTLNLNDQSLGGTSTQDRMDLITFGVPFVLGLNPFGVGVDRAADISLLLGPDIANFFVGYSIARGVIWVGAFCCMLIYLMWRLWHEKDAVSRMLFWLLLSITATYFSYAEYWISFPMLLVFVLVHATAGPNPVESQLAMKKLVLAPQAGGTPNRIGEGLCES